MIAQGHTTSDDAETRRREAMAAAERCVQVLRQRFGARRVVPFGSLVGDGPWHRGSDLDLAVEGPSSQTLWTAQKHLETVAPSWLTVDLAPLEQVYPEVRTRILREQPMPEKRRGMAPCVAGANGRIGRRRASAAAPGRLVAGPG